MASPGSESAGAGPDATRQRRLVDGLVRRLAAEHGDVRHLETHISHVLVAGGHAWKIKKALRLPFVDYGTLARRRLCCDEELRLNRRLAPALYLDVVPIGGPPDHPRFGGDGEVLDYAVKMRAFPQDALLSSRLAAGALPAARIDELADQVAAFHAAIPVAGPSSPHGDPRRVLADALENFDEVEPLAEPGQRACVAALRQWTRDAFRHVEPVLRQRKRDGFVRECHGDLHLGNAVLIDERVVVFDGIEFNDDLRWIDVMAEAAFTTMDLADRGRDDYAWRFLNRYLEGTGDYGGVAVLRFHLVYRAMVRAKVGLLRASQLEGAAALAMRDDAGRYVALAHRLAAVPPLALLLTHGASGSGKTTLTQALVEALPAIRVRSDVERKRLMGLAPLAASGSAIDAGLYGAEATTRTYERLASHARRILAAGYSVILDGTFLRRSQRDAAAAVAAAQDVPVILLDLRVPEAMLRERVQARAAGGGDASEATVPVLERQLATREPLAPHEKRAAVTIGPRTPFARVAAAVRARVAAGR